MMPESHSIEACWWPLDRIGEALEAAGRRTGLIRRARPEPMLVPKDFLADHGKHIGHWIDWASEQLGIEAVAVDSSVPDLDDLLQGGGPTILSHNLDSKPGFYVLLKAKAGRPQFLTPDLRVMSCAAESVIDTFCAGLAKPVISEIDTVLHAAHISEDRHASVRAAMLRERLATTYLGGIWMLRLPASANFLTQLRHAGVLNKLVIIIALFSALYLMEIIAWRVIGSAALEGRLDFGWLLAWFLLVVTLIPWRLLASWFEASFALGSARILKSRLLAGAFAMASNSIKHSGVGHLISRVMESQALESLALNGGMGVAISILELGFAGWILWQGGAGHIHLTLLLGWTLMTVWLCWRYHQRLRNWSTQRLGMTHNLIEAMIGHRTRLAQERATRREASEDSSLLSYVDASRRMDESGLFMQTGLPSGWIMLGLIGMSPAFISGSATTPAAMAISLGGLLLAQRAFSGISTGLAGLSRAAFAWQQVGTLFDAAQVDMTARPFLPQDNISTTARLIDARGLSFQYPGSDERAIAAIDIDIQRGDRILLQGPSGGGKSTLAGLLTGLHKPDTGMILLNGLDRATLGDNWHRLATAAPQFHENHILSGTIGFNLLMGRQWPASDSDLREAESLCKELGLGDLLARMPGGINQRVGETGWQLSHGERSRIFLARALLQRAPLTVMDESFAALDPETLEQCLSCAMRRAESLVVIAHP